MNPRLRPFLLLLFGLTGCSALILQVVWQRVISMHGGVDLYSVTTVVSAFLAGLGVGGLAGGWLADRLGARGSILAFSISNLGIAAFALLSVKLFYDVYRQVIVPLETRGVVSFAFHFGLLIVPTFLMGVSLPLVSKGVVLRVGEAGPLVGRLYSINTLGAAAGAALAGWFLLGTLGFEGSVRVAAGGNAIAAISVLALWRTVAKRHDAAPAGVQPEGTAGPIDSAIAVRGRPAAWIALYAFTGAVALGLEIVFFRVLDAVVKSNSYSFGHILSVYLLLFGAGAAVGARLIRTRRWNPARAFLYTQAAVGISAIAGVVALVWLPRAVGLGNEAAAYFSSGGYITGFELSDRADYVRLFFVYVVGPLVVMGAPVSLMGASFPFIQSVVATNMDTLGRRTGMLFFSNVAGNVAGALLSGFVLMESLGSSGTIRFLATGLAVASMVLLVVIEQPKMVTVAGAIAALLLLNLVMPSNPRLWSHLHGVKPADLTLTEERSCATALKHGEGNSELYVNGASQNGYPFDDFHVLIGLTPVLMHDRPQKALAIGLGIGATSYGLGQDRRVQTVRAVEICAGEVPLLESLISRGAWELERLLEDERFTPVVGDGREHLLRTDEQYDVITVDTLRPTTGYSGNVYSVEFYELVRDKLADGGFLAQWGPTPRGINGFTRVFPYVLSFTVESYNNSRFLVGSTRPIDFDRSEILFRLAALDPLISFSEEQAAAITNFLSTEQPEALPRSVPGDVNRDLFPKDEYFLNNGF